MTRVFLAAVAVLFALGVIPLAMAQTAPPTPVVFVAVDAFSYGATSCKFTVTGIAEGDAAASDKSFTYPCESNTNNELRRRLESCERMALLAMAKPGLYLFQVTPYPGYYYPACQLTRVNP